MRSRKRIGLMAALLAAALTVSSCMGGSGGEQSTTPAGQESTSAPVASSAAGGSSAGGSTASGSTGSSDSTAPGSSGSESSAPGSGSATTTVSASPLPVPKGSIEVVSFYPAGSADYQRLQDDAKAFEAKYPGTKVNLIFGGGQDTPKIQARWRAGNPPEVNYGFFDGTSPATFKYAQAGQVLALNPWMDQPLEGYNGTWKGSLLQSVTPFISQGSTIYAVPESISTIQVYYNKSIFDKYGIEVPKTLSDLDAAAAKLKAAGVAPFAVTGTFNGYMQLWYDYLLLRTTGAQNVQAAIAGTRDFKSLPGVADAANYLEKFVKQGYFLNGFQSTDFTAAQLNFFQGNAGMILMGSWLLGEMKQSIPADFEVGTFPFPAIDGAQGDQDAIFGSTNNQVVAAQSKNPEAGVAWLMFLAEKQNQEKFVQATGQISAYKGVAPPEDFADVIPGLDQPNAFVPSYFGVFGAGQKVMDAYQKPIAELFFGKISASEMVAEIDSNLRSAAGG